MKNRKKVKFLQNRKTPKEDGQERTSPNGKSMNLKRPSSESYIMTHKLWLIAAMSYNILIINQTALPVFLGARKFGNYLE